uniref:Zinc finger protein 277-like isoform X2 n=1 Tax=Crassostrea virginica TaxID=6565 RepID=A0A8B8B7Y6_CRAVI|nr:zinc finger protein 277-like isoform X2 [Crassostrea virginica]
MQSSDKPILESLNLFYHESETSGRDSSPTQNSGDVACLFCQEQFDTVEQREDLLRHLAVVHKFVIGDVNLITDLKKYLTYWRQRFLEEDLTNFCSLISTKAKNANKGSEDQYYLLCDVLAEDKTLREFLQKKKLEKVLAQQQREREDENFCRTCLFCREQFTGNRADMFDHMTHDHGFSVGLPDNLVYTDEFLDILQEKLDKLQCLYCERTFKDKTVLKEHMRKKQHKKINPKNRKYDKFYIINYLEMGRSWEVIQAEPDEEVGTETETEDEESWEDWEEAGSQAVCLFCDFSSCVPHKLNAHMQQELHDFDLKEVKLRLNLNFYQQIKLINFMRRQIYLGTCFGCGEKFDERRALVEHMHTQQHVDKLPESSAWDQPQYFFPTYENDNLLCQLEDDDNDVEDDTEGASGRSQVIAEDLPYLNTILAHESVRKEILSGDIT